MLTYAQFDEEDLVFEITFEFFCVCGGQEIEERKPWSSIKQTTHFN